MLMYVFPTSWKQVFLTSLLAMLLIDCYLLLTGINFYAGFSGINYALIGFGIYNPNPHSEITLRAQALNAPKKSSKNLISNNSTKNKSFFTTVLVILCLIFYLLFLAKEQHINSSLTWYTMKEAHVLGFVAGFGTAFLLEIHNYITTFSYKNTNPYIHNLH